MQRHEIPTHLNVEDKAFYGLSVRQVTYLTTGAASGYALWTQWHALPELLRLTPPLASFLLAAAVALIRPLGRPLEQWAFVALHYVAAPKRCVWRPGAVDTTHHRMAEEKWVELVPRLNRQFRDDVGPVMP